MTGITRDRGWRGNHDAAFRLERAVTLDLPINFVAEFQVYRLDALHRPCTVEAPTRRNEMIKSELVKRIASQNALLSHRDVEKIVDAVLDEIIEAMAGGDRVELRGFGAFSVRVRKARTGRNPRTGLPVR